MAVKILLGLVVAILILGTAAGFYFGIARTDSTPMPASISTITIGTTTVAVEVVNTDAARALGLSGRAGLAAGSGMLFVFDSPGDYGFWMKDMQFSLDMLFIDSSGTVVTLDSDVSPQSYYQTPPQVFHPRLPVTYVLEVPAGFAAAHGVVEGMYAQFK